MHCISLWQPWATLIAIGAKKIETRSWHTDYRGPLAIHAAKKIGSLDSAANSLAIEAISEYERSHGRMDPMPLGAVVAICDLVDCVYFGPDYQRQPEPELSFGDFTEGRWGFVLANVRKLAKPIPMRGFQRIFDRPDELFR
jgi:activating signal cointegrator 1